MSNGTYGTGWRSRKSSATWARVRKRWFEANLPPYDCALCGSPILGEPVSLDHIVPVAKDETRWKDITNLQATHEACNRAKSQYHRKPRIPTNPIKGFKS